MKFWLCQHSLTYLHTWTTVSTICAGRWQSLIEQFRHENFRLHQLSSQCMFTVALQSGLAALKTPQCYKHNFVLSGGSHDTTQ